MKRLFVISAFVLAGLGGWVAQGQAPRDDVSAFMRLKLTHAQQVLEGITTEDYELIAKNAQAMSLLSQDEHWMVYQTPTYRHHSADFQQITNTLSKEAQRKNLDGATLAYVQMTMSCVNCHKYTRGIRMAGLRVPRPEWID